MRGLLLQLLVGISSLSTPPSSAAEDLAGGVKIFELDVGGDAEAVAADIEGGGDLFEGSIAGAFADAVDGALDLARAVGDGGQRVGNGQAQVVVTMRREDDARGVDGRDALADLGEHAAVFFGGGVADGVWHVDGGCAGLDGYADHFDEEIAIGAGGVFGGELNVVDMSARQLDGLRRQVECL